MRNILSLILFLPLVTFAQDSSIQNSQYEQFTYQPGHLIKNQDSATGHLDDMWFYHSTAKDINDHSSVSAVFIVQTGQDYHNSLIIDMGEISTISKTLDYFRSQALVRPDEALSKYRFITNGDIQVSLYFDKKWLYLLQKIYHGSNAIRVPNNMIVVTDKEIDKFLEQLKRASS